jgi:hypothetical protein
MKRLMCFAFSLVALTLGAVIAGCGGGGSSPPPPPPPITVTVTVANSTFLVEAGSTVVITAVANNDTSGKGVTWSMSPMTGTLTNTTTISVTYNAPATPPPSDVQVTITATSVADPTKSNNVGLDVPAVFVSLSASVNPVQACPTQPCPAGTSLITATVSNDPANNGVDPNSWTITSPAPAVGTLSNPTSTTVTYTAPASRPASDVQVIIQATSVSDKTKQGSIQITFAAIAVSVAPNPATVAEDTSPQFTATVSFDPNSLGVSWTLTQGTPPISCSPACGTLSATSSPSGTPITYNAPSVVPSPAAVTLTATSMSDITRSGSSRFTVVNPDSALKGQYAFLFHGFDDATGKQVAVAGSFTADGLGNITGGEEDINEPTVVHTGVAITGGTYVVGLDNRGTATFNNSLLASVTYAFALGSFNSGVASKGRLIEFDDAAPGTTGRRGSGLMRLQDPTAFSLTSIKGLYGFGISGQDSSGGRIAAAGLFSADGNGNISGGTEDINDAGTVTPNSVSFTGLYSPPDANGRVTGSVTTTQTTNFSLYVVSASEAFLMTTDAESISGLESGTVLSQASTTFTNGSLNAGSVFYEVGVNATPATKSDVRIGLFTADGSGGLTIVSDENDGGVITANNTTSGLTYAVASNGRVTITGGTGAPPILYLVDTNKAFLLGANGSVGFGFLEPQSGGQFGSFSITGDYFFGVAPPAVTASTTSSGIGVASHPCGGFFRRCFNNLHVTQDNSLSNGTLGSGGSSNTSFTVFANGRATTTNTSVIYLISTSKFVRIDESTADIAPTVSISDR